MFKAVRNKLYMVAYFLVGALILEGTAFSVLHLGFMPEYFWMNFALIFAIAILVYVIPNYTAQYVVYSIILLVQTIFIYVNYSLYSIYGDLFSIDMLKFMGEATRAVTANFIYFSIILQLACVFLSISVLGGFLLKFCRHEKVNLKKHFSLWAVVLFIVCELLSCGFYAGRRNLIEKVSAFGDDGYVESDAFVMNTNLLKRSSYSKFGTYGYFFNLLVNRISDYDQSIQNSTVSYFNSGEMYDSSNSDVFGIDANNNVIVIMMESLEWIGFSNGVYDTTLSNLSNELTPNIYSLIYGETGEDDDSIISRNFFAKSKTNISEGFANLGSFPIGYSLSEIAGKKYDSSLNAFGYSLPSMLKEKGYTTTYIHSNILPFYERAITHKNIGFDTLVGKDTIKKDGKNIYTGDELLWNHWTAEGDFARNAIDYIVPTNYNEKPFYSFYLNVSSHGSYEYNPDEEDCMRYKYYVMYGADDCVLMNGNYVINPNIAEQDLTYTTWYQNILDTYYEKDPKLCNELVYFECGVIGLDDAIGVIVDKLKEYNIYDKTTMLLFSDHYAYYDHMANRFKGFSNEEFSDIELNTIPMILSSPGVKARNATATEKYIINDRFCSAYDIVPTILDLLGIQYNQNFYLGKSIFSPTDYIYTIDEQVKEMLVYYSNTSGMFCQDCYTYDLTNFTFENENITEEQKNEIIAIFKQEAKKTLYKINYLSILNRYYLYNKIEQK